MTSWPRRIGILGGLGPYGHLELEQRLLTAVARRLGRPPRDQEFPPWILVSRPDIPDRTAAILGTGASPVDALVDGLAMLGGADFAVIPCNTAHCFLDEVRPRVSIPILDMVGETIRHVAERFGPCARVGLLATTGTLASGVFTRVAQHAAPGVRVLTLHDTGLDTAAADRMHHRSVMGVIYGRPDADDDLCGGVKGGAHHVPVVRQRMVAELRSVLERFRAAGASAVILGCTELPTVAEPLALDELSLIDPLEIVADAALDVASGRRDLPG